MLQEHNFSYPCQEVLCKILKSDLICNPEKNSFSICLHILIFCNVFSKEHAGSCVLLHEEQSTKRGGL